jgi:hypothetical protein
MRHLFLGAHPQTLRRRLQSEGTNFQTLKNESRRDLAIYRLAKSDHSAGTLQENVASLNPTPLTRAGLA